MKNIEKIEPTLLKGYENLSFKDKEHIDILSTEISNSINEIE